MLVRLLLPILLCAWVLPSWADATQPIRAIPKSYVSPGASGSVSGSAHYQHGRRLPQAPLREESRYGSHASEVRGGIRQSIEYPGGLRLELQPGSGSYQQQRSR
jgi:hypothetical protein